MLCTLCMRTLLHYGTLHAVSCSDLLEGLRQIVDIQAASFRNRKDAVLAGLMRTEHDARTRSSCLQAS